MAIIKIWWLLLWLGACQPEMEKPVDAPSMQASMPGAAVKVNELKTDTAYRQLVINQFSSITAENAMKMDALSRGAGQYFWDDADYLVNFARSHHQRVHGHTLLWYRALPAWVNQFSGDRAAWIALMKQYIHDVVGHFKGKVASWDVVNEAFLDDGTLRPGPWLDHIGNAYIALAFQFAHEADPDALLFYNDYGHEYSPAKRQAIQAMVDSLKQQQVPIHGLGMQMHMDIYRSEAHIQQAIQWASAQQLLVHVSELDVCVNPTNEPISFTDELSGKQAQVYGYVAKAMQQVPGSQRYGITVWGVVDTYSWKFSSPDWPLLFDAHYQKKPAYDATVGPVLP